MNRINIFYDKIHYRVNIEAKKNCKFYKILFFNFFPN